MFELKFLPGFLFSEVGRFRIRDSGFVRSAVFLVQYMFLLGTLVAQFSAVYHKKWDMNWPSKSAVDELCCL